MKILDFLKEKIKFNQKKIASSKPLFENYDDAQPRIHSEILEGRRGKKFVRVDADFFGDMIDEIRNNPNCSYVTYLNDLIKLDGLTPSYISVLMKHIHNDEYHFVDNEILSSRIANALGVPTVYNAKFQSDDENFLLSVDFLKYGSKIINIDDWRNELSETIGLHRDNSKFVSEVLEMEEIIHLHNAMAKNNQWKVDKNFRSEYLKHYLTRNFVLGDLDGYSGNVCFVVDKDNNLSIGPQFDTEFTFSAVSKNVYDILFAMKYLPETLNEFNEKFKNIFSKPVLKGIFSGFDKKYASKMCNFLKKCYTQYEDICNEAKKMLEWDYEKY